MAKKSHAVDKIHCNTCIAKTKHNIVNTQTRHGSEPYDEHYDIDWTNVYDLLECRGCEEITLRRRFYFSEWNPGDVQVTYYPPRIARRLPPWKDKLEDDVSEMLVEVYAALQADSRSLAMMGARALIDMVMLQHVGDVGSFEKKLAALEGEGFLSKQNKAVLSVALDVGSAAAHRGHRPTSGDVQHVMDIVENLLHTTVLPKIAEELKKSTPQRVKKSKSDETKGKIYTAAPSPAPQSNTAARIIGP